MRLATWLRDEIFRASPSKSGVSPRPARLLDIGCGRGEHLAVFAELGFEVSGTDISPRAPELARGFDVAVADLEKEDLPFAPESFDFVFSKSVVEHLRNPDRLLTASFTALRPGGVAAVMTPSWAHNFWGPFYIDHTHVTPFTAPSLEQAMVLAGYEDVRVTHFYQLPFLWRWPALRVLAKLIAVLPLPFRPFRPAPWPDGLNKLIRFSNEVMLLAVGRKPTT
jgi:SAM-dependent methyltransferase